MKPPPFRTRPETGLSGAFPPRTLPAKMTIRELAKTLGLGKTTVADALAGKNTVGETTRLLVRAKAAELGYRPNPAASAFLRQIRARRPAARPCNLAYLATLPRGAGIAQAPASQRLFHEGARRRAEQLGYGFDTLYTNAPRMSGPRLAEILVSRGVLGVIAGPLPESAGQLELDCSRFAVVTPGYSLRSPRPHRVGTHCAQGIEAVLHACHARGLRRVGLALTDEADERMQRAWSGAMLARQRLLPATDRVEPLLLPRARWTARALTAWRRRERPDAIVLSHRAAWIAPAGPRRPPLLISLDRAPDDTGAGIDQRHAHCGATAIDLLSTRILHNETGLPAHPVTVLIEGAWCDEDTPRPPPPSSGGF